MDVNEDGHVDVLSGSYSRPDSDMAGLFQVLSGRADGTFAAAVALRGTDGEPLIITPADRVSSRNAVVQKICTRPFAIDLDGDRDLDLVVGTFMGTFAVFEGQGKGRFTPKNTWLQTDHGSLRVDNHGDPFLIDLDGDGDFDLLSGSSRGGVFLSENVGSKQEPRFTEPRTLVPPSDARSDDVRFGDAHLQGPQGCTRVCAADVDGDGKLDLLVGDSVQLEHPADGIDEATAREKLADWESRNQELQRRRWTLQNTDEGRERYQAAYEKLRAEHDRIVRTEHTGFVWVFYGR